MKKYNKRLILTLFVFCVAFLGSVSAPVINQKVYAAETVKLNKKSVTLTKGKSTTLKLKGTKKKAKWTSSNKKVAIVSQKGKVTAKKKGTAKITATVGNKKYSCNVRVTNSIKDNYKSLEKYLNNYGYESKDGQSYIAGDDGDYSWIVAYDRQKKQFEFMMAEDSYNAQGAMTVTIKPANYKKANVEMAWVLRRQLVGYSGKGTFNPATYVRKSTIPLKFDTCVGISSSQAQKSASLFLNLLLAEAESGIHERTGMTLTDLGFR